MKTLRWSTLAFFILFAFFGKLAFSEIEDFTDDCPGPGCPGNSTPSVLGNETANAEAAIIAEGLTVGNVTTEHHPNVETGNVISQIPTAGTNVAAGSAVDLVVSLGAIVAGIGDSKQIPIVPTTKGAISEANKENHFHFYVEKAGSFTIETQGSTDTYMSLFGPNSSTTLIEENDDIEVGTNHNSRIIINLSPDTYHVTIRHYASSGQGEYTISIRADR